MDIIPEPKTLFFVTAVEVRIWISNQGSGMDPERLVEDYIDAWNTHDVDRLLGLMHEGVAYYDAFWMESCAGRDAFEYLRNCFDDDEYRCQKVGDVVVIDDFVSFRYAAYASADASFSQVLFHGAEVLSIQDGKIVTVSDYYCDPDPDALEEITRLAARRHGLPKYAESGLSAYKAFRYRVQLSVKMEREKVFLDPDLTLSQLSDQIACSVDHLSQILNSEFGTDFHVLVNENRVAFARDLLLIRSDHPDYLAQVATQAGFRSFDEFCCSFERTFGETPSEFYQRNAKNIESGNTSTLH